MTRFLLLFGLAVSLIGQTRYSATSGDVALVATGYKMTLQQPSSNAKGVQLEAITIYCSVACDVTQTQNGTAATSTAGTATPILPNGITAAANVFTASDVGNGTGIGGIIHFPAMTEPRTLLVDKMALPARGTRTNYTIVIASLSGTVNIAMFWSEQQ